jgi:hypothetical protein
MATFQSKVIHGPKTKRRWGKKRYRPVKKGFRDPPKKK